MNLILIIDHSEVASCQCLHVYLSRTALSINTSHLLLDTRVPFIVEIGAYETGNFVSYLFDPNE